MYALFSIVTEHGFDLDLLMPGHRVGQLQVYKEVLHRVDVVRLGHAEA